MRTALPFVFALVTALAWGLYGPTLGQARLADAAASPFKPYFAIGVAYLVVAISGGLLGMWLRGDTFSFGASGAGALGWGFLAGLLGAAGAFGLTMAMFTGGARIPHAVMPVVFGGAVTVSALYGFFTSTAESRGGPLLWLGVALMLASTILITANTPHPPPPPAAGSSAR